MIAVKNRRHLLRWIVASAGMILGVWPALGRRRSAQVFSQTPSPTPSLPPESFKEVAKVEDLENGWLLVTEGFEPGPLLIVQPDAESETLVALNAKCTHANCFENWELEEGELVCTCHGSRFDLEGKVTKGPARKDLPGYVLKVEEGAILVSDAEA